MFVRGVPKHNHMMHQNKKSNNAKADLLFIFVTVAYITSNIDSVLAFQSSSLSQQRHSFDASRERIPIIINHRHHHPNYQRIPTLCMSNNSNNNDNSLLPTPLQTIRSSPSTNSATDKMLTTTSQPQQKQPLQLQVQLETLTRIIVPSALASFVAFLIFPPISLGLSYLINDSATFAVLSVDSSQFIQNFLTVTGLTFSILVGQTYYFMYQQQEAVFVSLFGEVTEAKSLLEQVALVCQGRKDMYEMCLVAVKR